MQVEAIEGWHKSWGTGRMKAINWKSVLVRRVGRTRKGVAAGTAEKKISILERALEHHPGSDPLLLALLEVVSYCSVTIQLNSRAHSKSCRRL